MKIYMEPSINKLAELIPDCDEFWSIVFVQHLEDALENYIDEMYPEGAKLGSLNDEFRYEAANVLRTIGADLAGTIYES